MRNSVPWEGLGRSHVLRVFGGLICNRRTKQYDLPALKRGRWTEDGGKDGTRPHQITHFLRMVSVVKRISEKSPIVFYRFLRLKEDHLRSGDYNMALMRNGSGMASTLPRAVSQDGASRGDQGAHCAPSLALFNQTLVILLFIDTNGDEQTREGRSGEDAGGSRTNN